MSTIDSVRALPELLQRVAAVVALVARGLAWASFAAAGVIGTAVVIEMDQRPVAGLLALAVLIGLLAIPGMALIAFRSAVCAAMELPAVVQSLPDQGSMSYDRVRRADGTLASGAEAARAVWDGSRQFGLIKTALVATRLSVVAAALLAAFVVPVEVIVAFVVVVSTAVL